jgi:carboxylesterase
MRPLGEAYHRAGFTVAGPRLAGHGTSPEDMATTGARDWIASVEAAFDDLRARCGQVFMTGLSMGGTLTLYMAARHPEAFAGIIPINAVVRLDSADMAAAAFDRDVPSLVPGIGSDIRKPGVDELAYPAIPVACFAELHALVSVTRALLPRIVAPTLILTSREDHVVPPLNAGLIAGAVSADRIEQVALPDSYHVATLDHDQDRIIAETLRFVRSMAG